MIEEGLKVEKTRYGRRDKIEKEVDRGRKEEGELPWMLSFTYLGNKLDPLDIGGLAVPVLARWCFARVATITGKTFVSLQRSQ